jgi:hypothetical protein
METDPDPRTEAAPEAWVAQLRIVTAAGRFHAGEVSVQRAIGELLSLVRDLLQLEVVFVSEVVEGRRVFRYIESQDGVARIEPGQSAPLEQTICQRILDGRMPNLVRDVDAVREAQGLPRTFEGMGTHIGVPVRMADGRLYGMLCGFNINGGLTELDERDVRRLEVAAGAAARLLASADGREHTPSDPALS